MAKIMATYFPSEDLNLNIARGLVKGTSHVNKFGFNDTVGTDWEPISVASSNFTYPTTAAVASLVSTSTEDDEDKGGGVEGTGAHRVEIQGLDEDYNLVTETLITNGTTARTSTNTFLRIFRARVLTAGSTGGLVGTISISVGGNTLATIDPVHDNQTLQAAYTVPAGHTAYVSRIQATSTKDNKAAMIGLFVRPPGDDTVWTVKQLIEAYRNSVVVDFPVPLVIPEKTDIELRGKNLNSGNVSIGGTFDLILIKDGLI